MANDERIHLAKNIREFKSNTRPQNPSLKGVREEKWCLKHLKVKYF